MIIVNSTLKYRQDGRSADTMTENLVRGMSIEKTVIALIVGAVLEPLPNVTYTNTEQDKVDKAPDLVLAHNGKTVTIEIQTLKKFYTGYVDVAACFHIKKHKMKRLGSGLSFICQNVETGPYEGVYFLHPDKIVGVIERPIYIFGNKPGFVVPVLENLIKENRLDTVVPVIINYLKG